MVQPHSIPFTYKLNIYFHSNKTHNPNIYQQVMTFTTTEMIFYIYFKVYKSTKHKFPKHYVSLYMGFELPIVKETQL